MGGGEVGVGCGRGKNGLHQFAMFTGSRADYPKHLLVFSSLIYLCVLSERWKSEPPSLSSLSFVLSFTAFFFFFCLPLKLHYFIFLRADGQAVAGPLTQSSLRNGNLSFCFRVSPVSKFDREALPFLFPLVFVPSFPT